MYCTFYEHHSNPDFSYATLLRRNKQRIMRFASVLAIIIIVVHSVNLFSACKYEIVETPEIDFTNTDTIPPVTKEVKNQDGTIMAKVTDNHGVESVILNGEYVIAPYEGQSRELRGWVRPISSGEMIIKMVRHGQIYSADIRVTRPTHLGEMYE